MRYQYRYTKDERRQLAAANRVLDDPTAPPREVNKALQHIQRIQDAAEGRAFDRAVSEPPPAPKEPTVDQLVADLEKPTLINQQLTDTPNAVNAATAPISAPTVPEVIPTAQEPLNDDLTVIQDLADGKKPAAQLVPEPPAPPAPVPPKCWNCDQPGEPTWDNRILCPVHFASEAARISRQSARRSWLYEQGETENTVDMSAIHPNATRSDWERSAILWRQQAQDEQDERARLIDAVEQKQARDRAELADFLSRGGRL